MGLSAHLHGANEEYDSVSAIPYGAHCCLIHRGFRVSTYVLEGAKLTIAETWGVGGGEHLAWAGKGLVMVSYAWGEWGGIESLGAFAPLAPWIKPLDFSYGKSDDTP